VTFSREIWLLFTKVLGNVHSPNWTCFSCRQLRLAWNRVEYHFLTAVRDGGPIEFEISGSGEDYIDFANTVLYVKAKITANNGDNLAADAAVGPTNLFLHSLFSQVDISLNGTLVTPSTNTYPYRAMLETLLSYGEDSKKSQLTSALFYKDTAGRMDAVVLPTLPS